MNKDVIYIEPENDITDIIDKVKTSKSALVALVPPKKSTVLSSAVNFKLLARASRAAGKSLVLVTADPALLKLSALAEIPAAKNLQTRPEVPQLDEAGDEAPAPKEEPEPIAREEESAAIEDISLDTPNEPPVPADLEIIEVEEEKPSEKVVSPSSDKDKKTDKKTKKDKKEKKDKSSIPAIERYRKWIIIGAIALLLIIGFLIWALIFAPAVKITVAIRTTGDNFSSNISFVTDPKKEIIEDGIFALETAETTEKASADFAATGEKNKGDKASGTITVSYTFTAMAVDPVTISTDTNFSNGSMSYKATSSTTLSYDPDACDESHPSYPLACLITAKIPVSATDPGEKYNTTATSGWTSSNSAINISSATIAGGTDKIVKVVSQRDFDAAKNLISASNESTGRSELLEKFPDSTFPIEGSLKIESKTPVSSPKVGEEVPEGVTPTISADTVFFMYGIDRGKINQYIEDQIKPKVAQGQKIYSTGVSSDPEQNKARIENYKAEGDTITAKLTSYGIQTGPDISEEEIFDKAKGRKIGEVRTLIKPLLGGNGNIEIEPSVFWVSSVPDDVEKVRIEIVIEE